MSLASPTIPLTPPSSAPVPAASVPGVPVSAPASAPAPAVSPRSAFPPFPSEGNAVNCSETAEPALPALREGEPLRAQQPPSPDDADVQVLSPEPISPDSRPRDSLGSIGSRFSLRHSRSSTAIRSPTTPFPRKPSRPLSIASAAQYADHFRRHSSSPVPFRVGVAEDRNKRWRRTMEDSHAFVYDFGGVSGQGFFGVFDGHAGKASAEWCGKYLYQYFREHLIQRGSEPVPDVLNATFQSADTALADLARETRTSSGCTAVACFLRLEDTNGVPVSGPDTGGIMPENQGLGGQAFIGGASVPPHVEGASTVAVVRSDSHAQGTPFASEVEVIPEHKPKGFLNSLARRTGWSSARRSLTESIHSTSSPNTSPKAGPITLNKDPSDGFLPRLLDPTASGAPFRRVLYTANVGDARAVLARRGKAVRLTYDHKGSDPQETARIKESGGFVMNTRVNGVLAVTRSLGDNSMKEFVVGKPFTTETILGPDDAFLIVACDGLWDVTSDQEAVDLIRNIDDAQDAAKALLKHALSNFSTDNTSVMVIRFNAKPETGFANRI